MKEIDVISLQAALLHTSRLIVEKESFLTQLDNIVGDGDHGTGMRDGFLELSQTALQKSYASLYDLVYASGVSLVKTMGGASGVIFGTLFIGGRNAFLDEAGTKLQSAGVYAFRSFFRQSAESIAKRGRAKPNDRTMLDALLHAVEAMDAYTGDDVQALLYEGWQGAQRGVEATKQMLPRMGRTKNFRDVALGYPDPGACSTAFIFQGLYEGLQNSEENEF